MLNIHGPCHYVLNLLRYRVQQAAYDLRGQRHLMKLGISDAVWSLVQNIHELGHCQDLSGPLVQQVAYGLDDQCHSMKSTMSDDLWSPLLNIHGPAQGILILLCCLGQQVGYDLRVQSQSSSLARWDARWSSPLGNIHRPVRWDLSPLETHFDCVPFHTCRDLHRVNWLWNSSIRCCRLLIFLSGVPQIPSAKLPFSREFEKELLDYAQQNALAKRWLREKVMKLVSGRFV